MSIYEDAKEAIEQWENHDRYRMTPGDELLFSNGHEPNDVAMAREVVRLTEALQRVAALSDEHDQPRNGWRIVEKMREAALDAIGNERTDG